eukprot:CAMPEP_0195301418 /NCGR_PEP_ID=MMETSP0707-20130614/29249_1 /TAXON_ID=33640 /ORGANISM="Asterionellopsis glacialis, Strain CCMP134" /LENGTH=145 /DNA_ID=CAMNT_0040364351 /DNA_START=227 /DNA_END=664 /DNA_ORIENTATION=-
MQPEGTKGLRIPEPTWSIKDLELSTIDIEPFSSAELNRLARKSLLDVRKVPESDSLRLELARMLHCLEQIKKVDLPEMSDREIYDVPRGVTATPLRSKTDSLRPEEEIEARRIFDEYLSPKTIQHNGSSYFSIVTKRDKISKDKS